MKFPAFPPLVLRCSAFSPLVLRCSSGHAANATSPFLRWSSAAPAGRRWGWLEFAEFQVFPPLLLRRSSGRLWSSPLKCIDEPDSEPGYTSRTHCAKHGPSNGVPLARLERLNRLGTAPRRFRVQYGYLKTLPDDYTGPRHVVTVKQLPPVEPGEDWFDWEERPGAAPASNATGPNDELVVRVSYVRRTRA